MTVAVPVNYDSSAPGDSFKQVVAGINSATTRLLVPGLLENVPEIQIPKITGRTCETPNWEVPGSVSENLRTRRVVENRQMQGARFLRNETYFLYVLSDGDLATPQMAVFRQPPRGTRHGHVHRTRQTEE